ncbi:MAG: helix-turn-helix domain-containing protein [Acidisphaera sp.]|nr:helix-turn-helix domain-containing protein [Acidisphaera sp.]
MSEVAGRLRMSTRTVRRWIERGELRVHHLGRQLPSPRRTSSPSSPGTGGDVLRSRSVLQCHDFLRLRYYSWSLKEITSGTIVITILA